MTICQRDYSWINYVLQQVRAVFVNTLVKNGNEKNNECILFDIGVARGNRQEPSADHNGSEERILIRRIKVIDIGL